MKKLFLIFIMTLAIIPIVKGQETATSGKKVLSSLIEKTSSINFPEFVIYKNEKWVREPSLDPSRPLTHPCR